MKILVAYDGSAGAAQAVALVGAIRWPKGSAIRIVGVIEPSMLQFASLPAGGHAARLIGQDAIDRFAADQADVVGRLSEPGRDVDAVLLRDRPASGLVAHAREFSADLLVVGSRGHGPIESLLLGSVAAEVVDHAGIPVLAARRPSLQTVVFATDGSATAMAAENILATWPIFETTPIRVVSVADVVRPWTAGIAPTMYAQVLKAYADDMNKAESHHLAIADAAARRLSEAGRQADPEVRRGDAAAQVMAAAQESGADLVVVGSRGHTGLKRMLLGSVARNVVTGSDASVLVVHDPVDA